jgi:predicted AAA+ superfamily ATPase
MGVNMNMVSRFCEIPDRSFFLFGPRGTGKTTWLRHRLPDALFVDLLLPGIYRELSARPERLRELIAGSPQAETVVIDEIQRVPNLLPLVHSLLESDRALRFVLTGSSARKLRRSGTDLLAGRALNRAMHPFMAAELPDFNLETALKRGLLPLVWAASDPDDVLRAYATLYLEEEVKAEGWARSVGDFARFLEVISFSHASVLNLANVAREAQLTRRIVASHVEILEDLLLAFRLPVFTRKAKRRTSVHPKFYLFDAGVYRSVRPRGPLDRPQEIDGAALEGLVAQHLRAWMAYTSGQHQLHFWRTAYGAEVDFIVYGEGGLCAIEVKNTARVRPSDLRSLKAFTADYPDATPVLLYRGEDRLRIKDIWCVPVEDFLQRLKPSEGVADWLTAR